MRIINARNVCGAYASGLELLQEIGQREESRVGPVLVAPYPVLTVYDRPQERVLFDPYRDANPFFHLFESLWMLSGSDDARWLDQFVRDFSSRFAEDSGRQWGAYGARWRYHWEYDQLGIVEEKLRANLNDRRVVITMWDPAWDLEPQRYDDGTQHVPRDVPCNTHIYPRLRPIGDGIRVLDLTVCCRSNDVVWGAYGANAVHFSVLQEYLAGRLGVGIGKLYQWSNNWHGYADVLKKVIPAHGMLRIRDEYATRNVSVLAMGNQWVLWDADLDRFFRWERGEMKTPSFFNDWFASVAVPMLETHRAWRAGRVHDASKIATGIQANDWRLAVMEWLARRGVE